MSALSSVFAEQNYEDLIEKYDGDYWLALAEFDLMNSDFPDDFESKVRYDTNGFPWKRIPGFSKYEVSLDGRVRSYIHNSPIELKPWYSSYGYPYVKLRDDNGKPHKFTIHSLVARSYVNNPKPEEYNVVRHLDNNPRNNYHSNLCWGTVAMNHQDMVDHGREFTKPVYCYEKNYIYNSAVEAANDLCVSKSSISNCCHGKIGVAGGYHFCFATDMDERLSNLEDWLDDSKSHGYRKLEATNLQTGKTIIFNSRKEASEFTGAPDCSISSVISGSLKQSHGWAFKDLSGEVKSA